MNMCHNLGYYTNVLCLLLGRLSATCLHFLLPLPNYYFLSIAFIMHQQQVCYWVCVCVGGCVVVWVCACVCACAHVYAVYKTALKNQCYKICIIHIQITENQATLHYT